MSQCRQQGWLKVDDEPTKVWSPSSSAGNEREEGVAAAKKINSECREGKGKHSDQQPCGLTLRSCVYFTVKGNKISLLDHLPLEKPNETIVFITSNSDVLKSQQIYKNTFVWLSFLEITSAYKTTVVTTNTETWVKGPKACSGITNGFENWSD